MCQWLRTVGKDYYLGSYSTEAVGWALLLVSDSLVRLMRWLTLVTASVLTGLWINFHTLEDGQDRLRTWTTVHSGDI